MKLKKGLYVLKPEFAEFYDWLCGFTDGDGYFTVQRNSKGRWSFMFQISQSTYNIRALVFIQRKLGCGKIFIEGIGKPLRLNGSDRALFRVQSQDLIKNLIFPIFERHLLLTQKYYDFLFFKRAFEIYSDASLSFVDKDKMILDLKQNHELDKLKGRPDSPAFLALDSSKAFLKERKFWIIGFTEAEGSFFLAKSKNSFKFAFSIVQKLDHSLMRMIAEALNLKVYVEPADMKICGHSVETISFLIEFFQGTLQGMKAVEFKIWCAAFKKYKSKQALDLSLIQADLRKLRLIRFAHPLCSNHPRYRESFLKDKISKLPEFSLKI